MRVRIHRGAHEIGGSCVEVEATGHRIVLDVGRPLDAERHEVVALPQIPGLIEPDPRLLGVVITHAHRDHWGLADQIADGVPLYLGEATSRILAEAAFWTNGLTVPPSAFLRHRHPFELGPFRITPYLNDHSAFDAYSLLVEADDGRLFYTGDIRGHGRKAGIFEQLLADPPRDVGVLLMEGTNIRAEPAQLDSPATESELELAMADTIKSTNGMVLVISSAQNIDRLVTVYRAAKRSGRDLIVDLYTASIARATGNPNIPQPGPAWPQLRVFVPRWQQVKVKRAGEFERVEAIKPYRVYEADLASNRQRLVLMFSEDSGQLLARAGALTGASAIWSLWSGYLSEPSGRRLRSFLASHDIPLVQHHTSGHASIEDLQRLATAIGARRVVPIHSFGSSRYPDYFDNVTTQPDGTWFEV